MTANLFRGARPLQTSRRSEIVSMQHDGDATILVADDHPDRRDIMSLLLRKAGFRVYTARDGREAYDMAQREQPLLVISDVMMPHVDGIELCRRLRADPKLYATPI